jgi:hypothetical protein
MYEFIAFRTIDRVKEKNREQPKPLSALSTVVAGARVGLHRRSILLQTRRLYHLVEARTNLVFTYIGLGLQYTPPSYGVVSTRPTVSGKHSSDYGW